MQRIVPRYLLKIFIPNFLLALGLFISVLLMGFFVRFFNIAVVRGVSPAWVLASFSFLLPYLLGLAAPMAFVVGVLLSLGQLSEDGEVLALRASGFSHREFLWPLFAVCVLICLVLLYINHSAGPLGYRAFKTRGAQALARISRFDPEPRTFHKVGEWRLYAESVGRGRMTGVLLFKYKGTEMRTRISAGEGRYRFKKGKGIMLELYDGDIDRSSARDPSSVLTAHFRKYRVFVPVDSAAAIRREPTVREMESGRIISLLKEKRESEGRAASPARVQLRVELSLRSAVALSPFVFFWIACPLGIGLERRSRAKGVALGLLVLFGYYGLAALGMSLGRREPSLAGIAPWMADAAGLIAGGCLTWRMLRR